MELTLALWMFAAGLSLGLPFQLYRNTTDQNVNFIGENETAFGQILAVNKGIIDQLLEGDIAPNPARSAMSCTHCLWPASENGSVLIPYEFSTEYSEFETKLLRISMSQMELMSCLKFIVRGQERDYVSIETSSGCWSVIGKTGGKQTVNLSKSGCMSTGTTQHEILHTLGFFHEQSRSDRDKYVDIMWKHIKQGSEGNFNQERTNNLDLPYDYGSVMHYPSYAFTNTPNGNTIIPKPNPNIPIGQRNGMSHLDVKKLNALYKCNVCRTKLTQGSGTFSSDGITFGPDGRCLWWIQVGFPQKAYLQLTIQNIASSPGCDDSYIKIYDGDTREAKVFMDKICGSVMVPPLISNVGDIIVEFVSNKDPALSKFSGVFKIVTQGGTFTYDNGFFMSPSYPTGYPNDIDAVYSIIAPAQSKVSLEFTVFQIKYCRYTCSCTCDYVMVIDGPSTNSPSLGKFCGFKQSLILESTGNVMLVLFHSDHNLPGKGFSAKYRFVPRG
uniref:Metalloendopeptidase n=1 Tax=Leptobrachium leishanense TaxID=445787 RepID=A0A8C5MQ20_9ANUR